MKFTLETKSGLEKPRFHADIMTYGEYAKRRHERPYEYQLAQGEKGLIFFGPGHTNDPENPAFKTIRERIENFKPDLVMIEGAEGINALSERELKAQLGKHTEREAIMKYGEPYFTAKVAADHGIKVISPEPSDKSALRALESQGHSREAIFCQQMASHCVQYARMRSKPDFETYLQPYLAHLRRDFKWDTFEFSLAHFKRIHEAMFGIAFEAATPELYKRAADPVHWEGQPYGPTSQVAAAWGVFRDKYILDTIQDAFEQYKKIFIVYGASHAVMLEPALRKLMGAS